MKNSLSMHILILMFIVSLLGEVFLIFILIISIMALIFFLIDDVLIVVVYNSRSNVLTHLGSFNKISTGL